MPDDFHFRREDRATKWRRIAEHLASNPDDIGIALENIERWLEWGRVHPAPLLEWRARLLAAKGSEDAFLKFIEAVAKDDCDSNPLKSCSPFVGLHGPESAPAPSNS